MKIKKNGLVYFGFDTKPEVKEKLDKFVKESGKVKHRLLTEIIESYLKKQGV